MSAATRRRAAVSMSAEPSTHIAGRLMRVPEGAGREESLKKGRLEGRPSRLTPNNRAYPCPLAREDLRCTCKPDLGGYGTE